MQTSGARRHTDTQLSEALISAQPDIERIMVREVDCNCILHE